MKRNNSSEAELCAEIPKEIWIEILLCLNVRERILLSQLSQFFYEMIPEVVKKLKYHYTGGSDASFSITNEALERFSYLESLELADGKIISDNTLQKLTKLQTLDLTNNGKITDCALKDLTRLKTLVLTNNYKITGEALFPLKLTSLYLDLANSYMDSDDYDDSIDYTGFPINNDVLSQLSTLTFLDLYGNELIIIDGLTSLQNLKEIRLGGGCGISDYDLPQLTSLHTLTITNDMEIMGDYLYLMTNLRELRIRQLSIMRMGNIAKLTQLTLLDVGNSQICMSDSELIGLTNLTYLDIANRNSLVTTNSLSELTNLNYLILDTDSSIQSLPFECS